MRNLSQLYGTWIHATSITCRIKYSFPYLNEGFGSTVSFSDCSTVNVMGKGNINIRTKNGILEIIFNVFYIPDMKSNVLSAGQMHMPPSPTPKKEKRKRKTNTKVM